MIIIEMMTIHSPQDVYKALNMSDINGDDIPIYIYMYIYIYTIIYPLCKRYLISKTLDRLGSPWSHEIRPMS